MITTHNPASLNGITGLGLKLVCAVGAIALFGGVHGSQARAQEMVSRPVVQSLGSEEVQDLGAALRRLARRPRDLSALLAAGNASLAVDDLDAAIGFFGRAQDLAPADPRVKLGMASVFVQSGRPVRALQLYNDLAASNTAGSGSAGANIVSDHGLAYDLVGDTSQAAARYKAALEINPEDAETARRLAISQAIAGDSAGFQETLRPLLAQSDPAAFRARAFGLAIMGQQARAASIVNEVMPRDLASRLTPYLAFMPRLTAAQQSAAANLGIFPRAADIGREDPAIVQYRALEGGQPAQLADASRPDTPSGADARLAPAGAPLGAPVPASDPAEQASAAPIQSPASTQVVPISAPTGPTVVFGSSPSRPKPQVRAEPAPSVADAFAGMDSDGPGTPERRADVVDLNAIDVPREASVQAEEQTPIVPRRYWVQVATGRDVSALRFDWRRIKRTAPDVLGDLKAHVTPWGEANRLLAGPVESARDARTMVNDLKAKGLDTFAYTSPEGAKINPLPES